MLKIFKMICLTVLNIGITTSLYSANNIMTDNLPPATEGKCLKTNENAPDLQLNLMSGERIRLYNQTKKQPVVLVFYRGGWCPFCNFQLKSYTDNITEINKSGAKLIAISVDKPSERYLKEGKLPFDVASDVKLEAINAYNVAFKVPKTLVNKYKENYKIDLEAESGEKHHTIAVPAIVIINKENKIKWCYANENYKIRPAVKALIQQLNKI